MWQVQFLIVGLFSLIMGSFFLLWVEPTQENTCNKAVLKRFKTFDSTRETDFNVVQVINI